MSFANYGPDLRVQSVITEVLGDNVIAIVANGAAETLTALVKSADTPLLADEIPLVLGEGTWFISARFALNPFNGAANYQLAQASLYRNYDPAFPPAPIATCPIAFAGAGANGAGGTFFGNTSIVQTIAPGATASFNWYLRTTGNSQVITVIGNYANIVATKLSA